MADQWDVTAPQGTINMSTIDTSIQTNNGALDRLLYTTRRNCQCITSGVAQFFVLPGTVAIPNSGGTVVRWRRNTATVTVTWANIDTGAEAGSTQYYVYAVADTDATTFTILISTSATAPTGATYYRLIGYFYNDASSNIISVGNYKDTNVTTPVSVVATSSQSAAAAYADLDSMILYVYAFGGPCILHFEAQQTGGDVTVQFDVDGASYGEIRNDVGSAAREIVSMTHILNLTAGLRTIKVQFKTEASGGTLTSRRFWVQEI